jgi:diguanylate cyclase (GGDEF)-like protein
VAVMDRLRGEVEGLRIPHAPGASTAFVTISVGIAELKPESTERIEDWLRRADTALYMAKTLGRNRVVMEGARESQSQVG